MLVTRSHLAAGGPARRVASPSMRVAISAASAARAALSPPMLPSCAWKVTLSRCSGTGGQRRASVLLVEKRCVGEAGTHNALVATPHDEGSLLWNVADGDKPRQQFAVGILYREVALMFLQRGDQHLPRQLQEAILKAPGDGDRPFHQCRDLIQQRRLDQCPAAHTQGDAA